MGFIENFDEYIRESFVYLSSGSWSLLYNSRSHALKLQYAVASLRKQPPLMLRENEKTRGTVTSMIVMLEEVVKMVSTRFIILLKYLT